MFSCTMYYIKVFIFSYMTVSWIFFQQNLSMIFSQKLFLPNPHKNQIVAVENLKTQHIEG